MGYAINQNYHRRINTYHNYLFAGIKMDTPRPLIDFKRFKTGDWMRWVVRQHWGYAYEDSRDSIRMECPYGCPPSKGNRVFCIDFKTGKFYTHCCKASGDALTLWCYLTGLPVYYAAVDMCRKRQLPIPWVDQGRSGADTSPISSG